LDLDLCIRCLRHKTCGHKFERIRVAAIESDLVRASLKTRGVRAKYKKIPGQPDTAVVDGVPEVDHAAVARVAWNSDEEEWSVYCERMIKTAGAVMQTEEGQAPHLALLDAEGKLHTDTDMPSMQTDEGTRGWHTHGEFDRANGPAYINGIYEAWYHMGKRHCTTGPARRYVVSGICGTCGPPPTEFWIDGKQVPSLPHAHSASASVE